MVAIVSGNITLRSLRTHISRLRMKLHLSEASGLRLTAMSKAGYRLESTAALACRQHQGDSP